MKLYKIGLLALSAVIFAFSACATAENTANKPAANNSNTAIVSNANAANKTETNSNANANSNGNSAVKDTSNSKTSANDSAADTVNGELQVGKSQSVILYVGMETGDYAGYCFANDSEAGRAILAACKDKQKCEVKGKVDYEAACEVPGLEADLSGRGRILTVSSAKSLGRK